MFDSWIDRALRYAVRNLALRNITKEHEKEYLQRYYIKRHHKKRGRWLPDVGYYVHCFLANDEQILHNHPFKWSVSLILSSGYIEYRLIGSRKDAENNPGPVRCRRRVLKPFRLNLIRANDFHRIDLRQGRAWTLFIAGPVVQSWGFINMSTGRYYPSEDYVFYRNQPGWHY